MANIGSVPRPLPGQPRIQQLAGAAPAGNAPASNAPAAPKKAPSAPASPAKKMPAWELPVIATSAVLSLGGFLGKNVLARATGLPWIGPAIAMVGQALFWGTVLLPGNQR